MGWSWIRKLFAACGIVAVACGEAVTEQDAGVRSEELSAAQARILGFEGPVGGSSGDWRPLAGTATSSTTRVEGQKSLALGSSQNPRVQSTAISALGQVSSSAKLSVSVPSGLSGQAWLGQFALRFDSPSAGVFNQYVGPVPFTGPAGAFREYTLPLPASISTKLSAPGYTDLKITIELNVPSTSGQFLLDKLILTPTSGTGGTGGGSGSGGAAAGGGAGSPGGSGGSSGGSGGQMGGSAGAGGAAGQSGGALSGGQGGGAGTGTGGSGGVGGLTYEFSIKTPDGVSPHSVAFAADGFLKVNDRVRMLKEVGPGYSSVSNVNGNVKAWFGPDSHVQNIWSKSGVELKNRAHVFGSIESELPVVREPDSIVDGPVDAQAELDPIQAHSWSITFPSSSQGSVNVNAPQVAVPPPGSRFGSYFVNTGAKLRLNPGIYYFDALTIEAGASLELLNAENPIQVYVRGPFRFRGAMTEAAAKNNTLFGIAGTPAAPAEAVIDKPFRGIIVAPHGQITLATSSVGHVGSFFGERIEAHQATPIKHRPFDPEMFCSGAQGCGGLCTCTPDKEPCTSTPHCQQGDHCPEEPNGWRFGLDPNIRVCEPVGCSEFASLLGCGSEDSACGMTCTDDVPCSGTGQGTCRQGKVCGTRNGDLLGSAFDNVCWDPICETPARTSHCGDADALCGICLCAPTCEGKVCGQDSSDGCGGRCTGFCGEREPGCTSDLDCVPGTACFIGEGPRIGLPEGTNVCLPTDCQSQTSADEDCGGTNARCGICPACVPRCGGRQCGIDPVCGEPCGTECADGEFCNGSGSCSASPEAPPVTVPDGAGGTRVVPPLEPQVTAAAGALPGRFAVSETGTATVTV